MGDCVLAEKCVVMKGFSLVQQTSQSESIAWGKHRQPGSR